MSGWQNFADGLTQNILDNYKHSAAIGVGIITKAVSPPKLTFWQRVTRQKREEQKYVDVVHLLVLDRQIPQEDWRPLSGFGDMASAQQNMARIDAIAAAKKYCNERGLALEYHFAPVAHIALSPAVVESIRRTAAVAAMKSHAPSPRVDLLKLKAEALSKVNKIEEEDTNPSHHEVQS